MKKILFFIQYIYKNTFSFLLRILFGKGCRFNPTCSEYSAKAILRYGILKGSLLSFQRLLRCNPFGGWGEDPVLD